jgi:hypothetical protein
MINLSRIPLAAVPLIGGLSLASLATAAEAGAVSPTPPVITVNPNNVMVNTDTMVKGVHFAPGRTLHLVECSQTMWVVPQSPCDSDNSKTVTTNSSGKFRTKMKVEACPSSGQPPGLSETCYIGAEKFGVDTGQLQPYASITVTFP